MIIQSFLNGISILKNAADTYEGTCFFLGLSALAVILLAVLCGKYGKCVFLYPAVFLALTVFNPWVLAALYGDRMEMSAAHAAFFWSFPVVLSIAAATVSLSASLRHPVLKAIPVALILALTFTTGVPDLSAYQNVALPDNLLKADPEAVALLGYMDEESSADEYLVAFEDETLMYKAVEYSAEVLTSDLFQSVSTGGESERGSSEDTDGSAGSGNSAAAYGTEALKAAIEGEQPDFLVVLSDGESARALKEIGLTESARTEHYSVFRA